MGVLDRLIMHRSLDPYQTARVKCHIRLRAPYQTARVVVPLNQVAPNVAMRQLGCLGALNSVYSYSSTVMGVCTSVYEIDFVSVKMAEGNSSDRFCSEIDTDSYINSMQNENTERKTASDVNMPHL
jgi:hypothetical protein